MHDPDNYPYLREVKSPLTEYQLRPLDPKCEVVQFCRPLTDKDHVRLAHFLRSYPSVPLRVYGHRPTELPNLRFLEHYEFLTEFQVDSYDLESTEGVELLNRSLKYFGLGQTRKRLSISFLESFPYLEELYLESQNSGINVLASLINLQRLTLRSVTLPDLALLQALKSLWYLDLKLGGTKDMSLLPSIGGLKYIELWACKGLDNLDSIGDITTLQNLYLQSLPNVKALPSMRSLKGLRRVTLDNMKGIQDLSPIADCLSLEELNVLDCNQLEVEAFTPFTGHPSLQAATLVFRSVKKVAKIRSLIEVPSGGFYKGEFEYR